MPTDKDGTTNDSTVTVDEDITASSNTDDDTDVLSYEFSKDFPEIRKHAELYEAEIAKLIANLELDGDVAVVVYRDIRCPEIKSVPVVGACSVTGARTSL